MIGSLRHLVAGVGRRLGVWTGRRIDLDAAHRDTAERSIAIYTVHRAGSMFVYRMTRDLCRELGLPHLSVNAGDLPPRPKPGELRRSPPTCHGPIRYPPDSVPPELSVLVHLRDPRDVLTSLFFSHTFSHPVGGGFRPSKDDRRRWAEQGIDAWVLERAETVRDDYATYVRLLRHPAVRLLRYETMVTDFRAWLGGFLAPFPLHDRSTVVEQLVAAYAGELDPVWEDPRRHRRQITPGDHRRKLTAGTRRRLDRIFEDVLSNLGYGD